VFAGAPLHSARAAAIVVHGRDQEPAWMIDMLVTHLELPDVAYVLPVAAGSSWYPGRYDDPNAANEPWVSSSLDAFDDALARLAATGIGAERVVVTGFSQGGCLVLEYVARRPRAFAGVGALTGALMGTPEEVAALAVALDGLPIFIGCSVQDSWLDIDDVERSAELLERAGARVTFHRYPQPEHTINDDEVRAVRELLRAASAR
jgi:phospholipase/carboxylesterase